MIMENILVVIQNFYKVFLTEPNLKHECSIVYDGWVYMCWWIERTKLRLITELHRKPLMLKLQTNPPLHIHLVICSADLTYNL